MFGSRLPDRLHENRVAAAARRLRQSGRPWIDLTETNPTKVGIEYPVVIPNALADPRGVTYDPEPFGLDEARRAVASTYPPDSPVSSDQVVLTSSTSEAYSFLFRLLCDAGDEVLVPRPSYPLFELLTRLDNVRDVPYRLDRDSAWGLDRGSLERALSPRTKAVLVVSPNNPTGSRIGRDDKEWLVGFAAAHGLAVIADEVFADYPLASRAGPVSFAGESRVLTFTLGGLSKSVGLPQMKLAWIVASGPVDLASRALERLSIVADSYLSVATPVQLAAGQLIAHGASVRAALHARLTRNLETLAALVPTRPDTTLYAPEGGWSAVLRVPAILSDDEFVVRLMDEYDVVVHPGYFFDIEGDGFLVTSLLPKPNDFERGIAAILDLVAEVGR
jgi:alanine-synthesizing transaminase